MKVARHGARIDQADKKWHVTAERPYDPPLTYGGWMQCQTLGSRIINELRLIDETSSLGSESKDEPGSHEVQQPRRKRRKIIIHSSPYLRCVQTAVAISAGMQHPQHVRRQSLRPHHRASVPRLTAWQSQDVGQLSHDHENELFRWTVSQEQADSIPAGQKRITLRIDPFLGEWLSPSYFEHSPPPPPSEELVSRAKDTLRVPAEEIKGADLFSVLSHEFLHVEWEERETEASALSVHERTGLRAVVAGGHSLPKRPRNVSFGSELANGARVRNRSLHRHQPGYNAPVPTYAIASSEPIPLGFVAHARDACVDIDYDWDSLQEPMNWGDGGPFEEEWGSMHRRFRHGFLRMLAFYEGVDEAVDEGDDDDDDDEDIVLVLVTHQAGCNALIRLLTGGPALHDIGTASLTMAVRKETSQVKAKATAESASPTRGRGLLDIGVADEFDMKIIASTEHLRAGSTPLGMNSPRLGKSPAFASRRVVGPDLPEGFSLGDPLSLRTPSGHVPGRSLSQRSYAADSGSPPGLWRRGSRYLRDDTTESSEASPQSGSATTNDSIPEELRIGPPSEVNLDPIHLPDRSASQRGLWGGESISRARSPGKRSWTAVDR